MLGTYLTGHKRPGSKVNSEIKDPIHAVKVKDVLVSRELMEAWFACSHFRLLCGAGSYPPNVLQSFETYCTNPALVSRFHLQRRSKSTGVRDLSQRKVELWARNVRSNLAIQLRLPR
jgi:hypothetical protein